MLLKRLLSEESVDHEGEHYTVRGARILPRPLQRPHPPLMIGGGGPRVLRLAARQADIVTFAPQVNASGRPRLDALTEKALTERVMRFRAAAGDRAERIELNVFVFDAAVTDRARSLMAAVSGYLRRAANGLMRSPFVLYGSRSSLRELLIERRERLASATSRCRATRCASSRRSSRSFAGPRAFWSEPACWSVAVSAPPCSLAPPSRSRRRRDRGRRGGRCARSTGWVPRSSEPPCGSGSWRSATVRRRRSRSATATPSFPRGGRARRPRARRSAGASTDRPRRRPG